MVKTGNICFEMVRMAKILNNFFFLILFLAAIAFIWQSLVQYQSKSTSYMRSEAPINAMDMPTLTLCMSNYLSQFPPYSPLGRDFNFSYYAYGFFNISTEGTTIIPVANETLNIRFMSTPMKLCYKINQTDINHKLNFRGIKVFFDESIPIEKLPQDFQFLLTSEDNAYGSTIEKRMNGRFFSHQEKIGHWSIMSINAERFVYLPETSGCVDKSFWEMFEPYYYQKINENCTNKCTPITLPSGR